MLFDVLSVQHRYNQFSSVQKNKKTTILFYTLPRARQSRMFFTFYRNGRVAVPAHYYHRHPEENDVGLKRDCLMSEPLFKRCR